MDYFGKKIVFSLGLGRFFKTCFSGRPRIEYSKSGLFWKKNCIKPQTGSILKIHGYKIIMEFGIPKTILKNHFSGRPHIEYSGTVNPIFFPYLQIKYRRFDSLLFRFKWMSFFF